MNLANWAGTHTYHAQKLHHPRSLGELQEIVAGARRVHVLGSRHSFTGIGDSEELVTLDGLPADLIVDRSARTASFVASLRYGELARRLASEGLALSNFASLPHISVAGAISTATHGSGDRNGSLATMVAGLELVTSAGEIVRATRRDPDFDGLVVSLGALGAVTRVTLDVEPAYLVRQRVFEGLGWEALFENFDAITSSGYSVSLFTRWREGIEQIWVKSRVGDAPERIRGELFGAPAAGTERHPIPGLDPVNCSPQLGLPGPASERLPHFRSGFTPSNGEEIQSEYIVARDDAIAAIQALRALRDTITPVLQVSEIRTIAADGLWMSPEYGRDSVAIHFTWRREPRAVKQALGVIEAGLTALGARPHWGKLFLARAGTLASSYERLADFARLVERLDSRGAFRNAWLEQHVLGPR